MPEIKNKKETKGIKETAIKTVVNFNTEKTVQAKKESKEKSNKEPQIENYSINLDDELDMNEPSTSSEQKMEKDDLSDLPESIRKKLEASGQDSKNKKSKRKKKNKVKKHVPIGRAYIKASYNNTIISLTDLEGNVISWASTGMAGFKGPKKSTSYAAQIITKIASVKAKEFGLEEVAVFVRGVGTGREAAIRTLNSSGINVSTIKDTTPIPHNGCRPKGPRRV